MGIASPSFRWTDTVFIGILEPSLAGREGLFPMNDADRYHLLGTYRTPRVRIGQRVPGVCDRLSNLDESESSLEGIDAEPSEG